MCKTRQYKTARKKGCSQIAKSEKYLALHSSMPGQGRQHPERPFLDTTCSTCFPLADVTGLSKLAQTDSETASTP